MGMYISQDPIGLAGGNPNIYGYVGDTNEWIDFFGLNKRGTKGKKKNKCKKVYFRFLSKKDADNLKAGKSIRAKSPNSNKKPADQVGGTKDTQYICKSSGTKSNKN